MDQKSQLLVSTQDFFSEMVEAALLKRSMKVATESSNYLVLLLDHYVTSDNFLKAKQEGEREVTLAEMLLRASMEDSPSIRADKYKKIGDSSLYISGFFGDSFKRKVIDIDYYAEVGGMAYNNLTAISSNDPFIDAYQEFSERFMEFVDILTYISQKSLVQTNKDILRLYDRYLATGSELAKEQLLERGILASDIKKASNQ